MKRRAKQMSGRKAKLSLGIILCTAAFLPAYLTALPSSPQESASAGGALPPLTKEQPAAPELALTAIPSVHAPVAAPVASHQPDVSTPPRDVYQAMRGAEVDGIVFSELADDEQTALELREYRREKFHSYWEKTRQLGG